MYEIKHNNIFLCCEGMFYTSIYTLNVIYAFCFISKHNMARRPIMFSCDLKLKTKSQKQHVGRKCYTSECTIFIVVFPIFFVDRTDKLAVTTLSHNVVSSTPHLNEIRTRSFSGNMH